MRKFHPEKKLASSMSDKDKQNYHMDFLEVKAVLGIDIYQYSDYPEEVQVYVPVLFNALYKETIKSCIEKEPFFFSNNLATEKQFHDFFISTGDGGFQIFDDPLEAIIFSSYFQLNITKFNSGCLSGNFNTNLFDIVGKLEVRYTITYDTIYSYDNNYYGPAIINNARIMSKDNLNRVLIDYPSINWFYNKINTIENLMIINKEDFAKIDCYKVYDKKHKSALFKEGNSKVIKSVDLLKIGAIKSKNSVLEIFNLKIQLHFKIPGINKVYDEFLLTLGNLNTKGID